MADNNKISEKSRKIVISVLIVVFALTLVGGTLAYLIFGMDIFNGNYISKTQCFNFSYSNTFNNQQITGELMPSKKDKGGINGTVSIASSCNVEATGNLLFKLNASSAVLASQVNPHCENASTLETLNYNETECNNADNAVWVTNGSALKYSVYDNSTGELLSVGYANTTVKDIKMYKKFNIPSDGSVVDFNIYIWLDGNLINDSYSDVSLSGYVYADATQRFPGQPNDPVLDSGMIPVTIANDGTVTTVSEDDPNWYDYSNKEWANIVLVNENATANVEGSQPRSYYLDNLSNNVEVNQSDILAYYVWIPRYKYKIWATEYSGLIEPQMIDIVFESENMAYSSGNAAGAYITHSAFWWDNDNDSSIDEGEMLSGMWVGKFETTGTSSKPTILPNANSLRNQKTNNQFKSSLLFAGGTFDSSTGVVSFGGNATYGMSSLVDTHMMKNSEWGAVTYLSHSKYGIGVTRVLMNTYCTLTATNVKIMKTGCGFSASDYEGTNGDSMSDNTACDNAMCVDEYGTVTTYPQSTTGNISGIFDMSGGSYDRVMGNYNNQDKYSFAMDYGSLPELKYYDVYSIDSMNSCSLISCGGDALYETLGWHYELKSPLERIYFVSAVLDKYWFSRGGAYAVIGSSIFFVGNGTGDIGENTTFRSVIINH